MGFGDCGAWVFRLSNILVGRVVAGVAGTSKVYVARTDDIQNSVSAASGERFSLSPLPALVSHDLVNFIHQQYGEESLTAVGAEESTKNEALSEASNANDECNSDLGSAMEDGWETSNALLPQRNTKRPPRSLQELLPQQRCRISAVNSTKRC